ncbi:Unknown protein [Striga hermonthica]|uniref:Elongin-A n=1 Tax=Striga hermonthica TaxID=68872 RepID=A0A9N7MYP4_STRHE|nr:Unknown protein [Striga hermonthica]
MQSPSTPVTSSPLLSSPAPISSLPGGARGTLVSMMRKPPSLVDLCVRMAIDKVRYLGNVGTVDNHLLDRILSHCTLDQLKHIEDCTEGRDLSPVTDILWKTFYSRDFGVDSANLVDQRLRKSKKTYKWRQLYEAKVQEREEATEQLVDRMKQRYEEENARKRSRQIQLCAKLPPSSKKRSFCGGVIASNIYNTKSGLMKKAKLDFVNSREVKNIAAMKNKVVHQYQSVSPVGKPHVTSGLGVKNTAGMKNKAVCKNQSVSPIGKPHATFGLASSSSSSSPPLSMTKMGKPVQRRF